MIAGPEQLEKRHYVQRDASFSENCMKVHPGEYACPLAKQQGR